MPTLAYTALEPARTGGAPDDGRGSIAVDERTARAIRDAIAASPLGALLPSHLPMLRTLSDEAGRGDDLRPLIAAIERHGALAVRIVDVPD